MIETELIIPPSKKRDCFLGYGFRDYEDTFYVKGRV